MAWADEAAQAGKDHWWQRKSHLHLAKAHPPVSPRSDPVVAKKGKHGSASGSVAGDCGGHGNGRGGDRAEERIELAPKGIHCRPIELQEQRHVEARRENAGRTRENEGSFAVARGSFIAFRRASISSGERAFAGGRFRRSSLTAPWSVSIILNEYQQRAMCR